MTFYTLYNLSDLCLPKFSYEIKYTVWEIFRYDFGWSIQDGGPRTAVPWSKLGFFIRGTIYNGIKMLNTTLITMADH